VEILFLTLLHPQAVVKVLFLGHLKEQQLQAVLVVEVQMAVLRPAPLELLIKVVQVVMVKLPVLFHRVVVEVQAQQEQTLHLQILVALEAQV
jgi:hypothetical protein